MGVRIDGSRAAFSVWSLAEAGYRVAYREDGAEGQQLIDASSLYATRIYTAYTYFRETPSGRSVGSSRPRIFHRPAGGRSVGCLVSTPKFSAARRSVSTVGQMWVLGRKPRREKKWVGPGSVTLNTFLVLRSLMYEIMSHNVV